MFVAPLFLTMSLASAQPAQLGFEGRAQRGLGRPFAAQPFAPPMLARQAPQPIGIGVPGTGAAAAENVGGPGDAAVLKNARLGATDDELVAFFRKRTPPAPAKETILDLIKRLGEKDSGAADKAEGELNAIGPPAVPLLRQASNNIDLGEGAIRAKQCLVNIEGPTAANLVTQAARLIATRKPTAAAEVLIGYLPFAEDDIVLAEIEVALIAVTVREGKADPAILKAIKDTNAVRRGAAANALCKAGGTAFHAEIRPLLQDTRPSVRLRAALGLVSAYDAEAIPVLIALLADLAPAQRVPVEEFLAGLAGEWAVGTPKGNDALSRRLRRDVWAAWWKNVEGPSLLEEIKGRTISNDDREKLLGLIKNLGDANVETRETASKDITQMGKKACPMLRQAVAVGDARITAFALKCIEAIDKDDEGALPSATPRLLALRRPEGTIPALIAYLPFAETPEMREQIVDILASIGCPAGKADEALVKALGDDVAIRRACAAAALCKGKATAQLPALEKLLADKDKQVVLRTAQGLASMGRKEAIPALIGLLKDLPIEQAWDVEEFLDLVAGEKSPTIALSAEVGGRVKAIEAWEKWWKENGKTTELTKIDLTRRDLGVYVMLEGYNQLLGSAGRVLEVDPSGKVRWELRNLQNPTDVQVLRNGNLLIVEQQFRVSERDKTGKVVGMNNNYGNVFQAERLRNGNTFIACRSQLLIVDPKGATVLTHTYHANSILAARHFRDGSMAYVSYGGQYVKLDSKGNQVETTNLNWNGRGVAGADISVDGKVLLSDNSRNVLVEFAKDGKQNWEASVPVPQIPVRTAGGNILVPGSSSTAIYEIDPRGKLVKKWEGFTFRPMKVTRR